MQASKAGAPITETVKTLLWLPEYQWLYQLKKADANVAPTFRFPDLISACVAIVFGMPGGPEALFTYMRCQLVLRDHQCSRREESMWRQQYQLLLDAQRSPANRHPNPMFQLDQLTTACVALARSDGEDGRHVFLQARVNMAARHAGGMPRTFN